MRYPTLDTRLIALLGNPLGHSVSPQMHNRVFSLLNLDYLYLPIETAPENLKTVFAGLTRMKVAGCNVTIPHKVPIMNFLDEIDPLAAVIGAVNTISIKNDRIKGFNTDGEGFIRSLTEKINDTVKGKRLFIIGSGGAARAIAVTLADQGAEKIYLYNRTIATAECLSREINRTFGPCSEVVPHNDGEGRAAVENAHVLVNTTSLGMHPHEHLTPIDEAWLFKELIVADIIYNPTKTRFLQAAERMGCRIVNGAGMLVYQGAAAFKIWTGISPPVEEMFKVVNDLVAGGKPPVSDVPVAGSRD